MNIRFSSSRIAALDDAELRRAEEAWRAGVPMDQIAERFSLPLRQFERIVTAIRKTDPNMFPLRFPRRSETRPAENFWTSTRIDEAARLWAEGKTTKEIAEIIGATRNQIIGIASRNRDRFRQRVDAYPRKEDAARKAPAQERRHKEPSNRFFSFGPGASPIVRKPTGPKPDAVNPDAGDPILFIDVRRFECHWIVGDVDGPRTRCCGADVPMDDKSPWCSFHREIGWQKLERAR